MKADTLVLPKHLEKISPWASDFPKRRYTWFSNEDIASILVNFNQHEEWMTSAVVKRPENGQVFLFNRKKVKYRQDAYTWKRRKNRQWPREDHVKLKVNGVPSITAVYVHSDIIPTFHRRCYWIVPNPDIGLVHYLNNPYVDDNANLSKDLCLNKQNKEWKHMSLEQILQQIKPMFSGIPWPNKNDSPMSPETVNIVASRLVNQHFDLLKERCNGQRQDADQHRITFPLSESRQGAMHGNCGTLVVPHGRPNAINNGRTVIIFNNAASIPNCIATLSSVSTKKPAIRPKISNQPQFPPSPLINDVNRLIQPSTLIPTSPLIYSNDCDEKLKENDFVQAPNNMSHLFADVSKTVQSLMSKERHVTYAHSPVYSNNNVALVNTPDSLTNSSYHTTPTTLSPHGEPSQASSVGTRKEVILVGSNIADSVSPETSIDSTQTKDYGVKDVMVPICKDVVMSNSSPFVETFSDHIDLCPDVFDVDDLFNTPINSVDSISDRASSSTESAACDMFAQQFWDPGFGDSDLVPSADDLCTPSESSCFPTAGVSGEDKLSSSELSTILDYSPDWSYTEGGAKILLTGTWSRDGNYECSFSDAPMPASIVQPGVLRCYCPAHEAGQVDLVVWRDGRVASQSVKFEYKRAGDHYSDASTQWLQLNGNNFISSILERLERMERRMSSIDASRESPQSNCNAPGGGLHYGIQVLHLDTSNNSFVGLDLEQRLISLCLRINRAFDLEELSINSADQGNPDGMTLLHYAAALGFSRLLRVLQFLRRQTRNSFLVLECNPSSLDTMNCTPLMWAAACNQLASVEVLCEWSSAELQTLDVWGRSPAAVAVQRGHVVVFRRLEQLLDEFVRNQLDRVDDDDASVASSIDHVTTSNAAESSDSGEDSMETDDNFSVIENDGAEASHLFPPRSVAAACNREEFPVGREGNCNYTTDNKENLLSGFEVTDTVLTGYPGSVAALAEQILEASPGRYNLTLDGAPERECSKVFDESELTLRSLPFYFNSRCSGDRYRRFANNQDFSMICPIKWSEFIQLPPKSSPNNRYRHDDIDLDTIRLTDHERRQFPRAAQAITDAYLHQMPVDTDVVRASVLIQRCYNKYKKFAMNKKMNEAAVLIQSKFRSYQEQKKFQKSRHAAILIQSFYRHYKCTRTGGRSTKQTVRMLEDALLRGHMTKKNQHQAARKIQRFLRRCRHRSSRVIEDSS